MDVTSYLPPIVVSALRHSEQTVACLPVRRCNDDTAFHPNARECPTEDGLVSVVPVCLFTHLTHSFAQDRIEITSENISSWLIDSPIIQKFAHPGVGRLTSLNEKLDLRPGDVVWIGKQRDRPEVKVLVYSFWAVGLTTA